MINDDELKKIVYKKEKEIDKWKKETTFHSITGKIVFEDKNSIIIQKKYGDEIRLDKTDIIKIEQVVKPLVEMKGFSYEDFWRGNKEGLN